MALIPLAKGKAKSPDEGWVFPLCYFTKMLALIELLTLCLPGLVFG